MYRSLPPANIDGAGREKWLRRRIAALEHHQVIRRRLVVQRKQELDDTIVKAQTEIDGLRQQLTITVSDTAIGVVR